MLLKEDTIYIQKQLATYCRDGKLIDIEGARADRLHNYRRLVYNVMYGILEKAYPIVKSILSEPEFKFLVSTYMTEHDAQEPQIWKVPGEFYSFVKDYEFQLKKTYPYLLDLLLMEWMEIYIYNRKDKKAPEFKLENPGLHDILAVNQDYIIKSFSYPVFKGNYNEISGKKGNFLLLIFRHQESKKVHFIEISSLHVSFIDFLENENNLKNSIQKINSLYKITDADESLISFIDKLYNQGFILGIKKC